MRLGEGGEGGTGRGRDAVGGGAGRSATCLVKGKRVRRVRGKKG